jgi:hypothetical protein
MVSNTCKTIAKSMINICMQAMVVLIYLEKQST